NANVRYKIGICYLNSRLNKKNALEYLLFSAENINKDYKADNHRERKAPVECLLYLGQAYRVNYKFNDALTTFNELLTRLTPQGKFDADLVAQTKREIEITNNAIYFTSHPVDASIKNMGSIINTEFCDHSPVIDMNEEYLIFTSKRPRAGEERVNQDEDIFLSKNKNFVWTEPKRLEDNVNTYKNEASIGFSADAKTLFIFRSEGPNYSNVMMTMTSDDLLWSDPKLLSADINTKFRETHACLSPDGNTLYFVSNREGGVGGRDIYKMNLLPDGSWSPPQCLSTDVNTIYDEETPFIHPDGITMFFSSKGHESMGGYDVFRTTIEGDNKFSKPENIGYPINTPDDEVSYVVNLDGRRAYLASSKDDTYGDLDIYEITQTGVYINTMVVYNGQVADINNQVPKDLVIRVNDKTNNTVQGVYRTGSTDGNYYLILQPGHEYLIEYEADGYLATTKTVSPERKDVNSFMEKYIPVPLDRVTLQSYKYHEYVYFVSDSIPYTIESVTALNDVAAKNSESDRLIVNINYLPEKEKEEISAKRAVYITDYLSTKGVEKTDIYLNGAFPAGYQDIYCLDMKETQEPVVITHLPLDTTDTGKKYGDTVYIDPVYFAFDRDEVRSQFFDSLNVLASYMKANPTASVEIGGHTDWYGTNEYNYLLSYRRSKHVKDYLVGKGVNPENLITTKFGEGTPIAENANPDGSDNPLGRQYNRRVEFKVLSQGTESFLVARKIVVPPSAGSNTKGTGSDGTHTQPKFTIQIMAVHNPVPDNYFADLIGVQLQKGQDGWYRYYVGSFDSYNQAKESLDKLKSMGYDPFIRRLSFFE
ncbi:MAG TPA: OmpA family protein, partial [Bacteroidales bacterium]|nr:OmpA family protein [Bacteroidales bacterium]